uniref:uncharacterized protein LOC101242769 isoform X1 n=1 Tax=Ciona intestinalis TaxID=7719 RepID=UPI000EF4F872|nr:uncharacterized protein LOC101242769 isoform X1 [Ciona intestinalis]|eukprot:XP_026694248.1 uncharacterized protein LOC101242769 isoform X1 [Ciona intestinalis]
MKVIVASFCKTGTKSMNEALSTFGYKIYDWMEHYWYHGDQWNRMLRSGVTLDDIRKMYDDVDVVIDTPSFLFFDEILEAYPAAKVILTVRDEDTWLASMTHELHSEASDSVLNVIQTFSYSGWKSFQFTNRVVNFTNGCWRLWPWSKYNVSPNVMKHIYRRHNNYVIQKVPKDRLLLFNLSDGWDPLCEFLGKEIPNKEFPHVNKSASIMRDYMATSPIMQRMIKETVVVVCVLLVVGVVGGGRIWRKLCCRGWFQ